MPANWPVEVNYYEAKAFCAWKGREYRLLAEVEHAALRNENDPNAVTNVQFLYGSSTPVDFFPPNKLGLHDVSGNVWCWLEDHLNGFPGFQTNYLYDDFTTPCFDGLHTAIAGGSWATNGFHVGKFSRFSFRRHFFQHLGFRMVKQKFDNATKLPIKLIRATDISITNVDCPFDEKELNDLCIQEDSKNLQFLLETPESLERALADDAPSGLNDFCLRECLKVIRRHFVPNETLLHIGCGTGGLAFGMKKYFKKVVGIDLFRSNIEICMKINGARDEKWSKNELSFKQITWIPNELSNQNVVIFSMAERVANLKAWSRRMPEVVGKCGILFSISRGTRHIFEDDELSMSKFVLIDDSSYEFENQTIRFTAWRK